jgi:hypothetical protein
MADLLVAASRKRDLFPFTGRGEAAEVEKRATVQGGVGNPDDSPQAEKCLLIDFIAAQQLLVIAKVSQEPAEPPDSLGSAVEAPIEGSALLPYGFENDKAQSVEGSLGMPAVEDLVNPDEEGAFQGVIAPGWRSV